MLEKIQAVLTEISRQYADERENLFQIQVLSFQDNHVSLGGRVLDHASLRVARQALEMSVPALEIEDSAVQVLYNPGAAVRHISVNLTSLHREPSWLAEQLSQLLYGVQVDVLQEKEKWAFVRCADGYLGWVYLPYTSAGLPPQATHLVVAPESLLRAEPAETAAVVSRVLGGTYVRLLQISGNWAQIQANYAGWLPLADLRALDALPRTTAERRKQMVADARRFTGVQYLWGGTNAHGIDCSGLAQLIHRLSGLTIRRDADMQMEDAREMDPAGLQPGDLVFFGEVGDRRSITHVGISLGGWQIIHSSRSRNGVYEDNLQEVEGLRTSFVGAATYLD